MKKTIHLLASFCLCLASAQAQNLITNGDFETYTGTCPSYAPNGLLINATGWKPPLATTGHGVPHAELYCNGTPNYGNCLPGPVPNTGSNGPAYVGFHTRNISPIYNEAIFQVLNTPLISATSYTIAFDLMTCQTGLFILGSSDFCVYTNIDTLIPACPADSPTVTLAGCVPFDSISNVQWKHHSFNFTAPPNSNIVAFSGAACFTTDVYYYLDNITLTVDTTTSIYQAVNNNNAGFSLNPFSDNSIYSFNYTTGENYSLQLFDARGRLVKSFDNIISGSITVSRNNMRSGLYYYHLKKSNTIIDSGKIIVH